MLRVDGHPGMLRSAAKHTERDSPTDTETQARQQQHLLCPNPQDPIAVFTRELAHGPDGISPPREHLAPRGWVNPSKDPSPEQGCLLSTEQMHLLSAFPIYHQPKAFILSSGPQPPQSETVTN